MSLFRSQQKALKHVPAPIADSPDPPASIKNGGLPIRVVIAMSAELERMGWGIIVSNQPDMQLIAQAASCSEVLSVLKVHHPHVTLIDETILDNSLSEDLRECSSQSNLTRFILVAPHELDYSRKQPKYAFTHAYLLKGVSATELLYTIRSAASETRP